MRTTHTILCKVGVAGMSEWVAVQIIETNLTRHSWSRRREWVDGNSNHSTILLCTNLSTNYRNRSYIQGSGTLGRGGVNGLMVSARQ